MSTTRFKEVKTSKVTKLGPGNTQCVQTSVRVWSQSQTKKPAVQEEKVLPQVDKPASFPKQVPTLAGWKQLGKPV
ncbi:hypothetical protein EB796_022043 [Bugula neritina]|uniref:Uncharacterized protein n=1 Tax=Bugula neritina TaxID=10212 RepID=A0A7J7J0H4_BUGNE|nr:hypothetical protein EB796_022043 [Bugula neritina]